MCCLLFLPKEKTDLSCMVGRSPEQKGGSCEDGGEENSDFPRALVTCLTALSSFFSLPYSLSPFFLFLLHVPYVSELLFSLLKKK